MKNLLKLSSLFLFAILMNSCGEQSGPANTAPTVTTNVATDINFTTAVSGGDVTSNGGEVITDRGICWSTSPSPTNADNVVSATTNVFSSSIIGLGQHGGTYYVRAYATNAIGTSYGNEVVFNSWNLDDTKWGFLLNYSTSNSNYPGDVDFFADGTTKWDEPDFPGIYVELGTWIVEGDIVTYYFTGDPAATSYVFTCTVVNNNTMSGTFTWGSNPAKTFTATKYP